MWSLKLCSKRCKQFDKMNIPPYESNTIINIITFIIYLKGSKS